MKTANSASLKQSTKVTKSLTSMSQKLKALTVTLNQFSQSLSKTSTSARSSKKKLQDLFSFDQINRLSSLTPENTKKSTAKKKTSSGGRSSGGRSSGGSSSKQSNATLKWLAKLKAALQPVWKLLQKLWSLKNDKLIANFAAFQKAVQKLSEQVSKGLKYAYDKVLKPLAKWTMQKAAPAVLHALTGAVNLLSGALNVIAPIAKSFYEHFLQPVASWAGDVFVGALQMLGDVLNGLGSAFDTVASHINGNGSILQALGGLAEGIADVLDNAVINGLTAIQGKLTGWVNEHIAKPLSGVNPVLSILLQLLKTPAQLFQEFKEAWANSPAIKALVELVKKDWKTLTDWIDSNPVVVALVQLAHKGWNTVRDWIKDFLGSPVEGLVTLAKSAWSNVHDWVKKYLGSPVEGLVALGKSAWSNVHDWVKKYLGSPVEALVSLLKNKWSTVAEWLKGRLGGSVSKGIGLSKNGWSSVAGWVKNHMGSSPSAIVKLQKGWSGSVASKLGLSNLSTTFKIKLPTVSISWSSSLFGLKVPKFHIKWNAKGAILNGAQLFGRSGNTLLGGGEAGREAVLPLDANTGWMDKIADKVAQKVSNPPTNTQNQSIQVNVTLDGRVVGRSVVQYVNGIAKTTGVNPLTAYV